jgi:hypothetical protein
MLGIGFGGFLVNAVRMIFLASVKNLDIEAQMFFYGAALFQAVCTGLSYVFVREYEQDPLCDKYRQSQSIDQRLEQTKLVYAANWRQAWAVAWCYAVYFSFFPGV